jgi:predicted nucleic acid-binding protein
VLVVDSSVWIDFFNGRDSTRCGPSCGACSTRAKIRLVVPDLVLFEVLRGFRDERDHRQARTLLEGLSVEPACDPDLALHAADHYRSLRARAHRAQRHRRAGGQPGASNATTRCCTGTAISTPSSNSRGLRGWRH